MSRPLIVNKDNIIIPEGTMEDFKRPDHPDFKVSSELARAKFSGLRHNSITNDAELWILGEIKGTVTAAQIKINPMAVNEMYEEVFALDKVLPDIVELRLLQEKKEKGLI